MVAALGASSQAARSHAHARKLYYEIWWPECPECPDSLTGSRLLRVATSKFAQTRLPISAPTWHVKWSCTSLLEWNIGLIFHIPWSGSLATSSLPLIALLIMVLQIKNVC